MRKSYKRLIEKARSQKKSIDQKFRKIQLKKDTTSIDQEVKQLHEDAFETIDCLECANCCKTTSPLLSKNDIRRMRKILGYSETDFNKKYIIVDEEGDGVSANPLSFFAAR